MPMAKPSPRMIRDVLLKLTRPPIETEDVEEQLRIRLMSSLFLFQMGMSLVVIVIYVPLRLDSIALPTAILLGILSLSCYALSRTAFYRYSVFLYSITMIATLFGIFVTNGDNLDAVPEYSLSYLIAVIFFVSLLLPLRVTALVASLCLTGIAVLPLIISDLLYPLHYLWLYTFIITILILITMWVRGDVLRRLKESEARTRNLLEAYFDAIMIYSPESGFLDVNPAFTTLTGYTIGDIRGKFPQDLIPDSAVHSGLADYESQPDHSQPFEITLQSKTGELIEVEWVSHPYEYEHEPVRMIMARDMRKFKLALRRQYEQEIRYQTLLEQTNDAVFIIDLEGNYLAVNDQAAEMFRATKDQLVGKSMMDFVPEVYHTASNRVLRRLLENTTISPYERVFIRTNGQRFSAEVTAKLIRDIDGNPQVIHSLVRDITTRKAMEEQRIELAIERERMTTLQEFLNDASHYFRTPLTSLKTTHYLLSKTSDDPVKLANYLNIINVDIARLERLISDMMLSTQLERDTGNGLTFGRIDVAQILDEIVTTYTPKEKRESYATLEITPPIPEKTLFIMASRAKISEAIRRLLDNAVTYSPEDSTVIINAYARGQQVYIEVNDSGIGITPEEMPFVFKRFARADRAIEVAHIGNGLGLSIAQKIVEMHYGEIEVDSTPDKGSTFRISLPMAIAAVPKTESKRPKPQDT